MDLAVPCTSYSSQGYGDKPGPVWGPCLALHSRYLTILTFSVCKYLPPWTVNVAKIKSVQSSGVKQGAGCNTVKKERKKWNTATRDEGQKDSRVGREHEGSSSRDDRGNRERREKEGEIVKRDIDDLLLALKPCCSCHRITQRQEHLLYPAAATWTWQGCLIYWTMLSNRHSHTHTHTHTLNAHIISLQRLSVITCTVKHQIFMLVHFHVVFLNWIATKEHFHLRWNIDYKDDLTGSAGFVLIQYIQVKFI